MSQEETDDADAFWREQGINQHAKEPVVTYIGMIGQNFQDDIIISAAETVWKKLF